MNLSVIYLFSGITSFKQATALSVRGYPMYGSSWVTAASKIALSLPTFRFPRICPLTCASQPPNETRIENVSNSRVFTSRAGRVW